MIKWIPQRFKYTRELENKVIEQNTELQAHRVAEDTLRQLFEEQRANRLKYTALTPEEAGTLFSATMDYHEALKMLNAADPIEHRIRPLMKKYDITIKRNEVNQSIPGVPKEGKSANDE